MSKKCYECKQIDICPSAPDYRKSCFVPKNSSEPIKPSPITNYRADIVAQKEAAEKAKRKAERAAKKAAEITK